jgi:hypothetical protein
MMIELWDGDQKLNISFSLDLNDKTCQIWAWTFKAKGYQAYALNCTPGKHKPVDVPIQILDYESPALLVERQIDQTKKFFTGSREFFMAKTIEMERIAKKTIDPQPIKPGSGLSKILESLISGVPESEFRLSLESLLNTRGYTIRKEADKFYLNEEINYG